MKRFFCLLFSVLLVLALCPGGFADSQGVSGRCVDLTLECGPGYGWMVQASDQEVVQVLDLGVSDQEESASLAFFRVQGAAAGTAEVTIARSRENEEELLLTLPVTVDEDLNVIAGSEISLPQEEGAAWVFDAKAGDILEVEEGEVFSLRPLAQGQEELTFTQVSGQEQLVLTCRVEQDSLWVSEIEYRTAPFNPAVSFTTTDFEGNTVTEQVFAGHSLTILNFWEPWCGPCVGEMPDLQKLSQEYADRGVQVIGVFATPDADEDVQAVLERTGVAYPILRYVQAFGPMQTGYVPTTVILDGTGAVVKGPFARALDYADWCALVEELL